MDRGFFVEFKHLAYVGFEKGRANEVSSMFSALTEYEPGEILYKTIDEVMHILNIPCEKIINNQATGINCYLLTKSHRNKYMDVYTKIEADKERMILVFMDSNSLYQADRLERDRLYNTINTLNLPLLRVSYPELCVIELNRKALEYFGSFDECSVADIKSSYSGESLFNFSGIFRLGKNRMCIKEMIATKTTVSSKNIEVARKGKKLYFNIMYQPIFDRENNITEFLIIIVDVTSEVIGRIEAENLLRLKEEFFSFISHEFRTPLTVINAAVQAMEVFCKDEISDKMKTYIDKIYQNSLRQLRLVNNIMDVAKAESGYIKLQKTNRDIVSLTKEISESVSIYAKQKGITLEFSSKFQRKIIGIDEEKYERILLNLLSNAIKFTPPGKKIYVRISSKKQRVCIDVIDEGIGIPVEKQDIIFQPFRQAGNDLTRESEGTGIGLSLVKLLINMLNGEITLKSKINKGSKFSILLPNTKFSEGIMENQLILTEGNRLLKAAEIEFSNTYKR